MGAFDLDSDEDEQIAERRRMKQREEARKRRLLLQDESIGKLGNNEKKEAFLRAIEDRDEDDEIDLLDGKDDNEDGAVPDSQQPGSQQDSQHDGTQPLAQVSGNASKRKIDDSQEGARKRTPASNRRNFYDQFRKPTSLAEVRESVSFLIEEPNSLEADIVLSESEAEYSDTEDGAGQPRAPFSERRTPAKPDIIDRLTLKRGSTSELSEASATGNMAFATAARPFNAFKTPSLLRRATTNMSATSASAAASHSMPPPPALNREGSSDIRRGGSKKSSINYAAREAERKAIVEKASRKREEGQRKLAGIRRKQGALGGLLGGFGGGFE